MCYVFEYSRSTPVLIREPTSFLRGEMISPYLLSFVVNIGAKSHFLLTWRIINSMETTWESPMEMPFNFFLLINSTHY
jgi:hypothetical protein